MRLIPKRARRLLREHREVLAVIGDIIRGRRNATAFPSGSVSGARPDERATSNALERFFDANVTGHGVWKWRHYFEAYDRHLAHFRHTDAHVLEIGIYSGGSLRMWRDYFGPTAAIYGVDIAEECRAYEAEGIRIFIGDQASHEFWARFRAEVPTLDVVIDDGGHHPDQQIATLDALLPHLRPGGVYICEDVNHDVLHRFHAYIYGLSQQLHVLEFDHPHGDHVFNSETTPLQKAVASIHQYPCMVIIERTATPRPVLRSEKHGTIWAPFIVKNRPHG